MNGQFVSLCFAILAIPAALFSWMTVAHKVRLWRVGRLVQSLTPDARTNILNRIAEAAHASSACTLLIPSGASVSSPETVNQSSLDVTQSQFGGQPYAEANELWPPRGDDGEETAPFLIQVRLNAALPFPWSGRLISVFLRSDQTQIVRVYPSPSREKHVPLGRSLSSESGIQLVPVPIPKADPSRFSSAVRQSVQTSELEQEVVTKVPGDDGVWQVPYDPAVLLEIVPGLRDDLRSMTIRPDDLLVQILAPQINGYLIDLADVVQMGGNPQWVWDDPRPLPCPTCERPMRFLFQFGDISGEGRLGRSGVCYVFGCDSHPDAASNVVQVS